MLVVSNFFDYLANQIAKEWAASHRVLVEGGGMENHLSNGMFYLAHIVNGRNPAPVDRWFIPLCIGFQPSKVVQDFFHPPYEKYGNVLYQ